MKWEVEVSSNKNKKKQKYRDKKKQNKLSAGLVVEKGNRVVLAGGKKYIVKKYEKMTPEERSREKDAFNHEFRKLIQNWSHKGIHFSYPKEDDTLTNMSIRHQQYVRALKCRMGSDMNKIMLVGSWAALQMAMKYMGIPADGFVQTQLDMFNVYQDRLIMIGESSIDSVVSIGENWSPWTWIMAITAMNAAILIGMNYMNFGQTATHSMMKGVTGMLSAGNMAVDASGVPLPPDQQPATKGVFESFGLNNEAAGGMLNMMMSFAGGNNNKPQQPKSETGRPVRKGPTHA
jgi:hypothetical protein